MKNHVQYFDETLNDRAINENSQSHGSFEKY